MAKMKFWYIYGKKFTKYLHGTRSLLYILMIFGIKEKWIILTHIMYCWPLLQIYLCCLRLVLCSRVIFDVQPYSWDTASDIVTTIKTHWTKAALAKCLLSFLFLLADHHEEETTTVCYYLSNASILLPYSGFGLLLHRFNWRREAGV